MANVYHDNFPTLTPAGTAHTIDPGGYWDTSSPDPQSLEPDSWLPVYLALGLCLAFVFVVWYHECSRSIQHHRHYYRRRKPQPVAAHLFNRRPGRY